MHHSKKIALAVSLIFSSLSQAQVYSDAGVKSDENVYLYQQYELPVAENNLAESKDILEQKLDQDTSPEQNSVKPVFLCISPNKTLASELKTLPLNAAITSNTLEGVNTKDCKLYFVHDNDKKIKLGLRNEDASLGQKLLRSSAHIAGLEVGMLGGLLLLPKSFTNWGQNSWPQIQSNFRRAWTTAPVWDKDSWVINFVSHPHSGSVYYNFMRSQNSTMLESFLFAVFQSTAWEYVWEAPFEQPSINDLIATPIGGAILGELSHRATLAMRKNGFKWYEKAAVIVINPAYWINNGFKKR